MKKPAKTPIGQQDSQDDFSEKDLGDLKQKYVRRKRKQARASNRLTAPRSKMVAKSVSGLEVLYETSVPEPTFKQSLNMLLTHLVSECYA